MASVPSAPPSESDSVGPSGIPPSHHIVFPPDASALHAIALECDRGSCPFKIGRNVSIDLFNQWLADSEDGLRVDYDEVNQQVVVREACSTSHGCIRRKIGNLLETVYLPHGYRAVMGRIVTAAGRPDLSPDGFIGCRLPTTGADHDVIALEVGASQTAAALSTRAETLLRDIPSLQFVVLVKVHDDTTAECRRLYAWTEARNPTGGNPVRSPVPPLEFGQVVAGGAPNPSYWLFLG